MYFTKRGYKYYGFYETTVNDQIVFVAVLSTEGAFVNKYKVFLGKRVQAIYQMLKKQTDSRIRSDRFCYECGDDIINPDADIVCACDIQDFDESD